MSSPKANSQAEAGQRFRCYTETAGEAFGWNKDNTIGAIATAKPLLKFVDCLYRDHRLQFQSLSSPHKAAKRSTMPKHSLSASATSLKAISSNHPFYMGILWVETVIIRKKVSLSSSTQLPTTETARLTLPLPKCLEGLAQIFTTPTNQPGLAIPDMRFERHSTTPYHYLNHHNLFGGGYANIAQSTINQLISWR